MRRLGKNIAATLVMTMTLSMCSTDKEGYGKKDRDYRKHKQSYQECIKEEEH